MFELVRGLLCEYFIGLLFVFFFVEFCCLYVEYLWFELMKCLYDEFLISLDICL